MQRRLLVWVPVLVLACLSLAACRQQQPAAGAASQFDPHDLSGFWMREGPRENKHPPMTPRGLKMMEGRKPETVFHNPAEVNDPMYKCNPQGFPRLTWEENEPFEIIHLPGRILHLYQWERTLRELWMDGRALPSGENLEKIGPTWYGHSVAQWEENTLVVNTTGLDERMWLDQFGNPISFDARGEERYTRTEPDVIEGKFTLYDEKNYTAPWTFPLMHFKRMKEQDVVFFGWKGLFSGVTEGDCAPMNEVDEFDKRVRDAALGIRH